MISATDAARRAGSRAHLHDDPDEVGVADRERKLQDAVEVGEELDVHLVRVLAAEHLAQRRVGDHLALRPLIVHGTALQSH